MGIKNFYKFLKKKAPGCIKQTKDLRETHPQLKKLGLDVSNVRRNSETPKLRFDKNLLKFVSSTFKRSKLPQLNQNINTFLFSGYFPLSLPKKQNSDEMAF